MNQTYSKKQKLHMLLVILIPILITQLAMYSMTFLDTLMTGRYNSEDLAGVAIGSSLWVPVFTGLSGILLAVTPIVSHLVGAKKQSEEVSFSVIQGVYLSIIMAVIVFAGGALSLNPILSGMNLENRVQDTAFNYLAALSTGLIPLFVYNVLRSFIDALGKTRVSMIITLLSLPINAVFNYILIYGEFGFPELGGAGAGYASAITYWLIMLISFYIIHKHSPFSTYGVFRKIHAVSFGKWKEILLIGIPIGLSIFFETSIFSAVTLLMSTFETSVIAAHQIALNFASLLYMIPLSISMALTIVVGFEAGASRFRDAKEYSWIGVGIAVFMALICAAILLAFPREVASIYTKDEKVLQLTAAFLVYAMFFQLSDAIQAPVQGALRGYKDVNVTFMMSLISYWIIGLPFGYYLANHTDWGAYGYWIGLITGLAAGAITLTARLINLQKRKYPAYMKAK